MKKVFIDGSAGTTGLRINERISSRTDIELITLTEEFRKDTNARREAINNADVVFLCLPDAAAIEAVSLVENDNTVIIDTSTAHRTSSGWTYGMPELKCQREKIATSKRIANPGCHASGFIALVAPLVDAGVIDKDIKLSSFSLTGYSGGGKKRITQYQDPSLGHLYESPRVYGLTQKHKHLPEMVAYGGVNNLPVFAPIIAPYYAGMEFSIPLFASDLKCSISELSDIYKAYYKNGFIHFADDPNDADEAGVLAANAFEGRDDMQLSVCGNDERALLIARYDNLGKGASGAAVQNMNIVLGIDESTGLVVE